MQASVKRKSTWPFLLPSHPDSLIFPAMMNCISKQKKASGSTKAACHGCAAGKMSNPEMVDPSPESVLPVEEGCEKTRPLDLHEGMVPIVQFIHSGIEETCKDKKKVFQNINGIDYMSMRPWKSASAKHGRRFLVNSGDYVLNSTKNCQSIHKDDLHFWCEAEWDTLCRELPLSLSDGFPTCEHRFQGVRPENIKSVETHLNTDPYVFGKGFKYCCCQQLKEIGGEYPLANLPEGAIILFGSPHKKNCTREEFHLDTVFVVERQLCRYNVGKDFEKGNPRNHLLKDGTISQLYFQRVLSTLTDLQAGNTPQTSCICAGNCDDFEYGQFTLYLGRAFSPDNEPLVPFSFVPVKPENNRYARPVLTSLQDGKGTDLITPTMTQGTKLSWVAKEQVPSIWENLLKALKGYDLAYHFDEE